MPMVGVTIASWWREGTLYGSKGLLFVVPTNADESGGRLSLRDTFKPQRRHTKCTPRSPLINSGVSASIVTSAGLSGLTTVFLQCSFYPPSILMKWAVLAPAQKVRHLH